jgi:hypothetical protein
MRTLLAPSLLLLAAACTGPSTSDKTTDTAPAETNNPPVAEAGPAVTQTADAAVQLNGGGSSDAEGDTLSFHWSFDRVPEGSTLPDKEKPFTSNNSAEAKQPSFTPDRVGTYIVKLVVNDGHVDSSPDFVVITITPPEDLPVANAGADLTGVVGTALTLDGGKSYDPKGMPLTYAWTLVDKPTASALTGLTGADTASPSFTGDARGRYTVHLVVNNGMASSLADAAVITVSGEDGAPVANAGDDQIVEDCTTVNLDCSTSVDPDGDLLTYNWAIQSKPAESAASDGSSFSDKTAAKPTFYPDEAGTYVLSCAVFDGKTWSTPDTLELTADERRSNSKPVVDAGADVPVTGGKAECTLSGYEYNCDECGKQTVTLGADARVSDPDGDPIVYSWSVADGSATITDPGSLTTTVTLEDAEPTEPGTCTDTEYRLELKATDCTGESTKDTVVFTVNCCGVEDTGP